MVQKPPVDIEWYNDGFSMEEQAKLKYEYLKAKKLARPFVSISVSKEYHENKKDQIISELRQKIAADEEYIKELEETSESGKLIAQLKEELRIEKERSENLKKCNKELKKENENLLKDPEKKYKDTIKDLEDKIKHMKKTSDELICKLLKYTNA